MFPFFKFLGLTLYYWGYVVAVLVTAMVAAWYRKKYDITALQVFFITVILLPLIFISIKFTGRFFDGYGGFNWVRMICFIPLFVYLACIAIDTPFIRTCDFFAPHVVLYNAVDHAFCIFSGCCHGYPSAFGIWNERQHAYLFPVQLFEAATSLLIFFYMIRYAKKKKYNTRSISYAQFLLLFGSTRTFWEFFRDNTEVRWQISTFQYYSFAAFLLGAIWIGILFYLQKHPEFVKKHELLFSNDIGEFTKIKMLLRRRGSDR